MKWSNESSPIQTKRGKHHSEAFGITGIPERLRYSPDSSHTFMHKQLQVSGAAFRAASFRLGSLDRQDLRCTGLKRQLAVHQEPDFHWNRCLLLWIVAYPRYETLRHISRLASPARNDLDWTVLKSCPATQLMQMWNVCVCVGVCVWVGGDYCSCVLVFFIPALRQHAQTMPLIAFLLPSSKHNMSLGLKINSLLKTMASCIVFIYLAKGQQHVGPL